MALRADPAHPPPETLRASLGTQTVGRPKQPIGHMTFLSQFCVSFLETTHTGNGALWSTGRGMGNSLDGVGTRGWPGSQEGSSPSVPQTQNETLGPGGVTGETAGLAPQQSPAGTWSKGKAWL